LAALLALVLAACGSATRVPIRSARRIAGPEVVRSGEVRTAVGPVARFASDADLLAFASELAVRDEFRFSMLETPNEPEMEDAGDSEDSDEQAPEQESITNTQEAGVDEGGIVKTHGDHLVVLRRGRLFSIRLADLTPVSMVDAYPPGSELGTWYDEMLVHDDTIVVVGYSYVNGTGATEIGLFDIDDAGVIRHRATRFLQSGDYYSSRNYASRLIGDTLVFYMPYMPFHSTHDENGRRAAFSLPGATTWARRAPVPEWQPLMQAGDVYRPARSGGSPFVLHTVVRCDLRSRDLSCTAQGMLGSNSRTFYVAEDAVYVWVMDSMPVERLRQEVFDAPGELYRLPLDGGEPAVLGVYGAPTDQFSFQQADGFLNVLVRAEGGGDFMWSPETTAGDVALMRVPVAALSGVAEVLPAAYTDLPEPRYGTIFHNRFIGGHVIYGTGDGWWTEARRDDTVYVHTLGGDTMALGLGHGVDRIEALGSDALVVGSSDDDLFFSELVLARTPRFGGYFVQADAAQGETRSHGFYFKPSGDGEGTLGLPVREGASEGYEQLAEGSAEILFLGLRAHRFTPLGELESGDDDTDDRCRMSCVDWYGNARPIFYRGRVYALLGYELVEGRLAGGRIGEVARVNYVERFLR
jgi:hypothetical protein